MVGVGRVSHPSARAIAIATRNGAPDNALNPGVGLLEGTEQAEEVHVGLEFKHLLPVWITPHSKFIGPVSRSAEAP